MITGELPDGSGAFALLSPKPGDTLIIRFNERVPSDRAYEVARRAREFVKGDIGIMVAGPEVSFTLLSVDEGEAKE